jgi:hypothetical protein
MIINVDQVTKCASENVLAVRLVKEKCQEEIDGYESCLSKNTSDPSICKSYMTALYDCTHRK